MRNITSCICIMGLSGVAFGGILMDQIGPDDGSCIGANIMSSQDFEAAFDQYDAVVGDNFDAAGGLNISLVEMILDGWNGFVDPSGVTGYNIGLYTGGAAASISLIGDIDQQTVDAIDVSQSGSWLGTGFLMGIPTELVTAAGTQYIGVNSANSFGGGFGQTGVSESVCGDATPAFQANPGGGFGIPGNVQDTNEAAYRVTAGEPADPCESPLGYCPEDIDGSLLVDVADILAIIADFGICGDGTFRPAGDIAPLPNGDCCVDVTDILAVIAAWGLDCTVVGGCCLDDGTCSEETSDDCATAGGVYFGDNTTCADGTCVTGACCLDLVVCVDVTSAACDALGASYKGDGTDCATTDCADVEPGDECTDPLPAYDGANPYDLTLMTPSPGDPDETACPILGWVGFAVQDVWYTWVATDSSDYIIDTCDLANGHDSSLVIYQGTCTNQIACSGDVANTACQLYYSEILLSATAGTKYYIRIGSWQNEVGVGTLNINKVAPPLPGACCFPDESCLDNLDSATCDSFGGSFAGEDTQCADGVCQAGAGDECTDAVEAFNGSNAFDTSLMTPSQPQPDPSTCTDAFLDWDNSPDMWMIYNSTFTGTVNFSLCDAASYDTSIVLYAADCVTQLACNGDSTVETGCQAYYSGIYDYPVLSGTSYVIRLGGWQGGSGAGTLTITKNDPNEVAACCAPDGSCTEITLPDCDALGGNWFTGALCADIACYSGCPQDGVAEGCVCFVDGDDAETDCNGGLNLATPVYGAIALDVPICGNASVYLDITGGTYRDLDWYSKSALNAGGNFSMNVSSSGMDLLFGIIDLNTGGAVALYVLPGGMEGSVAFAPIAAGNYAVIAAPADWNTDWTCASGLVDYVIELTSP